MTHQCVFIDEPVSGGDRIRYILVGSPALLIMEVAWVQRHPSENAFRVKSVDGELYVGPYKPMQIPNELPTISPIASSLQSVPATKLVTDNSTRPDCFWIDLNNLRPLERLLWELQCSKLTEAQTMALIQEEGLSTADHPAFPMIMNDSRRNRLVICSHSSHNTPEKKEECVRVQAAKLAVRTVRHYLGYLERHQIWANQPGNPLSYAMWTCIERGGHVACVSCRSREGIIERAGQTRVLVLHPNCHCTLTCLAPGSLGDSTIKRIVYYLGNTDPARAQQFANNIKNSGWVFGR